MNEDISFEAYIAAGGKLSSPANASPRYRGEIMRLMAVFVDSEMAGAAGFADSINFAPGLKERMIAARIVLEKFGHAERVLKLMQEFGANTTRYVKQHPWAVRQSRDADLGKRRREGDMRLNVFHYPLNDWCDAVTMNLLMGGATVLQLEELRQCSYQPLADVMTDIVKVEQRHADLGEEGVRVLLQDGMAVDTVQESINYWAPRVADTFGSAASERQGLLETFGLRQRGNEALLNQWQSDMQTRLSSMQLALP